jgi:hypothetical protein
MPRFTVNTIIQNAIITQLSLQQAAMADKHDHDAATISTKKFLQHVTNICKQWVSYDILKQYIDNVPEVSMLLSDNNKITLTITDIDEEYVSDDNSDMVPDLSDDYEDDSIDDNMAGSMPDDTDADFPIVEPDNTDEDDEENPGEGARSIVAKMAANARKRSKK